MTAVSVSRRWKLVLITASAVFLAGFFWGDKDKKEVPKSQNAGKAAAPQTNVSTSSPVEETLNIGDAIAIGNESGRIVYAFDSDAQMKEFAQMWQQRRGVITRLAVLRAYLSEEQARIAEFNQRFSGDYGVDVAKRFVLDSDRGILIELEVPAEDETVEQEPAAAAENPT